MGSHPGWHHTQDAKDRIRLSHIGMTHSVVSKNKIRAFRKGKCFLTDEQKKKIGKKLEGRVPWNKGLPKEQHPMYGRKQSPESIEKNRRSNLGKHKHSEKTIQIISEANRMEKNSHWMGGKSFEPYNTDWTKCLKKNIRKRDRYCCGICGKPESNEAHDVHHKDYNKKNCSLENLITLCNVCHSKTNTHREYWRQYFGIAS